MMGFTLTLLMLLIDSQTAQEAGRSLRAACCGGPERREGEGGVSYQKPGLCIRTGTKRKFCGGGKPLSLLSRIEGAPFPWVKYLPSSTEPAGIYFQFQQLGGKVVSWNQGRGEEATGTLSLKALLLGKPFEIPCRWVFALRGRSPCKYSFAKYFDGLCLSGLNTTR